MIDTSGSQSEQNSKCCGVCSDTTLDVTTVCPECNTTGPRVDLITVKALLKPAAMRRLEGESYRFCPVSGCEVVYFDRSTGFRFRKADLLVRVGRKESEDPIPVCYCFDFTLADLRRDLLTHGQTNIAETIAQEIRAGHCACEVKNPEGSCCLGNVREAVKRIRSDMSRATVGGSRS